MDIKFPEIQTLGNVDQDRLFELLAMLDVDGVDWSKIRKFSLILAQAQDIYRYVGKAIQMNDRQGWGLAMARQVYGQHMMGVFSGAVTEPINDQMEWLNREAFKLGDGAFQAVLIFQPQRGQLGIALSRGRSTQISLVVKQDTHQRFTLQEEAVFREQLNEDSKRRVAALDAARTQFGDNFPGLPA